MERKQWVMVGVVGLVAILALGWWRDQNVAAEPVVPGEEPGSTLETGTWQLQDYAGETGYQTVILGTTITAKFADGTLTGNAGCNSYFGSYTVNDTQLTISQTGSTMMACDPPVMDQEQAYLSLLGEVSSYAVSEGQLTFKNSKGQGILIYNPVTAVSLEGIPWQTTGVNNGKGGVETTVTTELITAIFADGTVSGNSGCNSYSGEYTVEGEAITIGPVAGTLRACADEQVNQQESEYLAAIEKATRYQIEGETLELRDDTGALQVSYTVKTE